MCCFLRDGTDVNITTFFRWEIKKPVTNCHVTVSKNIPVRCWQKIIRLELFSIHYCSVITYMPIWFGRVSKCEGIFFWVYALILFIFNFRPTCMWVVSFIGFSLGLGLVSSSSVCLNLNKSGCATPHIWIMDVLDFMNYTNMYR